MEAKEAGGAGSAIGRQVFIGVEFQVRLQPAGSIPTAVADGNESTTSRSSVAGGIGADDSDIGAPLTVAMTMGPHLGGADPALWRSQHCTPRSIVEPVGREKAVAFWN